MPIPSPSGGANKVGSDWHDLRQRAMSLLEQEAQLQQIVRLVGADSLPDRQRWVLDAARLVEEGFLQQNALHPIDAYSTPEKQVKLLQLFLDLFEQGRDLLALGVPAFRLRETLDRPRLIRLKEEVPNDDSSQIDQVRQDLKDQFQALADEYRQQQ